MGAAYDSVKTSSRDSFDELVRCSGYASNMLEKIDFSSALAVAHQFRSDLLDSFSDIERWVNNMAGKEKSITGCLGQKLSTLSKHNDKAVKKLAGEIEQALPLRNAIVHSKLDMVKAQDGERLCLLLSASEIPNCAVMLKASEVTDYLKKVRSLANRCQQLTSRPETSTEVAKTTKATTPTAPAGSSATASK